jgi:dTDP-4-amino-4,6-dideoxygalactose transaminase
MRNVPYVNFPAQFAAEKTEIMGLIEGVFSRGDFIAGEAVARFEEEVAKYCGVAQAVALNSGTDALILGMKALGIGPGDEVITPPNSFVASTAVIVAVGATPVFADVRDDQNLDPAAVAAAITPRTKAIMPVHLTGRIADMDMLLPIAERHGLAVIEDAAQSIGSLYNGKKSGSFGHIGCFSGHPLKNLNAAGDAGFLTTNDQAIADRVRLLRNHGLIDRNTVVEWGMVSRLDTLQAEILRFRLGRLDEVIARRRANAELYRKLLADIGPVFIPPCRSMEFNSFHVFVIQVDRRDELQKHLTEKGIGTGIHYPVPIHLQPAAKSLGHGLGSFPICERQSSRILSLPINQFVGEEDIAYICEQIAAFYV